MDLRDQAVETVEDTMTQARTKAQQITIEVRDKAEELQQRGQEIFDEQKKRLSAVVESGQKDVQDSLP
jgi:vacuolar-type H+-ATPase subunit H